MNYKSKFLILGLVSKIFAANFSVVSFDGDCQLNIGGALQPMTADPNVPNLYKASVQVQPGTTYNYVCGGKEDVQRTLAGETTYNELVGRELTVDTNFHEFGYPNAEPWTRSLGRTELFDPTYVPIIIIDHDVNYFKTSAGTPTFAKMDFILKENVFSFQNVQVLETKNRGEDKFQFTIKLPTEEGIYNRDVLKFRPSAYDPSFFRQILYGDIAHAVGNPAHESVAVRVYLKDGTPIGLYVLQEDVSSESFIRTAFYGNPDGTVRPYTKTPIYDCATGADFNYNDANFLGGFISSEGVADLKIELKEMTKHLLDTNVMDVNSIKDLDDNWLDLDTLMRALALEYLGGHWDSFWFLTSNFLTYHPAEETEGQPNMYTKYKYYFVDQDFDQTFSIGLKPTLGPLQATPYTEYVNKDASYWHDVVNADEGDKDAGTRVLINKLLGCDGQPTCATKDLFENHLKSMVQHIFNPVAIGKKVESYRRRLDNEVLWDHSFQRLHVGTQRLAALIDNYDMYVRSFEEGVNSSHGLLTWVTEMTNYVCSQFNIQYDQVALTPETVNQINAQPIDPGTTYDTTVTTSGSIKMNANIVLMVIATLLSVVLFL